MEATLAVINTTSAVVKIRPGKKKKKQARTRSEPITFAIPVQRSTNWANKPVGSWSKLSRDQSCRFMVVAAKAKFVSKTVSKENVICCSKGSTLICETKQFLKQEFCEKTSTEICASFADWRFQKWAFECWSDFL